MTRAVNPVYAIILVRSAQASALALAMHWLLRWPLTGPHALVLFFTPLLCLYFLLVFVGPWSWGLPILTRLPTHEKVVAVTFDDGPSPETTAHVLDILKGYGVSATFFVLGEAVEQHPDLLRRIIKDGHTIGIHAYRHHPFVLLSSKAVKKEIDATRAAITRASPQAAPIWLRPPYGFKSLTLPVVAKRAGCRLVTWSLNTRDYRAQVPMRIVETVRQKLCPGAIILLHDGVGSAATVAALPLILEEVKDAGYRCVGLNPPGHPACCRRSRPGRSE